jgi:hypothetical protein
LGYISNIMIELDKAIELVADVYGLHVPDIKEALVRVRISLAHEAGNEITGHSSASADKQLWKQVAPC